MRQADLNTKNRLASICKNFGLEDLAMVECIDEGLINDTYLVRTNNDRYIVQRLHNEFPFELLEDIEKVTEFLEGKDQLTPKLLPAKNGRSGYEEGDEIWRVFTYIPGRSLESFDPKQAYEAASMIGRFHYLLTELDYDFKFSLPRVHRTREVIAQLEKVNKKNKVSAKHELLNRLTESIVDKYKKVEKTIRELPDRVIHGDLKASNIRFEETCHRALCLLDLDTMGKNKIVHDIGDMVRSWCMVSRGGVMSFDLKLFRTIIRGYVSTAKFLTDDEKLAINDGIKVVTLKLSARYVTDAYEEKYFKLDRRKYTNLNEQNTLKAIDLMNFYKEVENSKASIDKVVGSYT